LITLNQIKERIQHTSSFAMSISSLSESNESSSFPPSETEIVKVWSSGSESMLHPSSYLGVVRSLVVIFWLICTYRTIYPHYRTQLGVRRYLDT
jgi:hypothetical protein